MVRPRGGSCAAGGSSGVPSRGTGPHGAGSHRWQGKSPVLHITACFTQDSQVDYNLYIYYEEMFFLFVDHVKTTGRIDMTLRTYDAISFVDGIGYFFDVITSIKSMESIECIYEQVSRYFPRVPLPYCVFALPYVTFCGIHRNIM